MKFNYDGFEIEIKAKREGCKRGTKDDIFRILNEISLLAHEASESYGKKGLNGMSKSAYDFSKATFKVLEENGAYDDCEI
jgi:hypothetical protein